ncbi:MAG: hypothetical protein ACTSO9_15375 [Candidatus Helarchaeota archaeon]
MRAIDDIYKAEDVILYYSHIKKEINPHINDVKVIGSDILSQFFSPDFIGVNRSPPRVIPDPDEMIKKVLSKGEFKSELEYKKALIFHKTRLFDPESYYYYNIDKYPHILSIDKKNLLKDEVNRLINSILVYSEIENTKNFVEKNKVIKN